MKPVGNVRISFPAKEWGQDLILIAKALLGLFAVIFAVQIIAEVTAFWSLVIGPFARLVPVVMIGGVVMLLVLIRKSRASRKPGMVSVWDRELDGSSEAMGGEKLGR